MSSVQSSSAAERANFALMGIVNGCSRGAIESMPEIPVNFEHASVAHRFGDHRECTPHALTLNDVSGAAVPVTPPTYPLGDPSLAHFAAGDGTRDRAISRLADILRILVQHTPR